MKKQARVLVNKKYGIDKEPYIVIELKRVEDGEWGMSKAYPISRMTGDLAQKFLNEIHDLQFNYDYEVQFVYNEVEEI